MIIQLKAVVWGLYFYSKIEIEKISIFEEEEFFNFFI